MAIEKRHQVIIVGGGPAGMGLAIELGQRGVSCVVVERYPSPQRIPKGQNLTQRTLEHFYFWGCEDELRAARVMPPGYPIGTIVAYDNLMSPHWYAPAGREAVQQFYFRRNERLPQYQTEEVLRARARELPDVTCLFGWSAERVEQHDDGVRVTITERGGQHAQPVVLEGDYVVGCDGARSTVREQLDIDRQGPDFDQRMVLAVFTSHELHEGLRRFPERTTYRVMRPELNGYWQFFGRVDVGAGWFFHAPVTNDSSLETLDLQGILERAAGFSFSSTIDYVGFWDLRIHVASSYRRGRGFIAGDAAHSHPPYGAFGLNSSLEDAKNLGWKLAAVLRGWADEALLDSYSAERQPVFAETGRGIAERIERDRELLREHSPDREPEKFHKAWDPDPASGAGRRAYEPHYEGSPVIAGPAGGTSGTRGPHSLKARPGHHLAPQALSSGRNAFEELGDDFTLLAFDADEACVGSIEQAARSLGVPLRVVRDDYDGERKAYESRHVLVRPDQHVAWAGDTVADAQALMRHVTARP